MSRCPSFQIDGFFSWELKLARNLTVPFGHGVNRHMVDRD
jgi:hypothetical protein